MDYQEALDYMHGLHRFGIKLGNERFEALLERLGNPHRARYGIAHVAGTKGKGSTTAMIASILQAHGFRTGGYYSPYVYDVRERIQIDGQMIPKDDFARLVTEIQPHSDAIGATEHGSITEFEMKTAIGFCYFLERKVQLAAVEVGLGGRLDATNVVLPDATVITNIGLDHTHILGGTHALIAAEKAGIIKPGIPCVTATDNASAQGVIRDIARQREAPLLMAAPAHKGDTGDVTWTECGETFDIRTPTRTYSELTSGLHGAYQRANAACAIAAVEMVSGVRGFAISTDAVRKGLAEVRMPGRFEVIRQRPTVVLDGAHNAMAADALAEEIRKLPFERLLLVVGMVQGHDAEGVLAPFAPLATKVFATEPSWMRRQDAEDVAVAASNLGCTVEVVTPPNKALEAALAEAGPDDLILVTGSFYTVGDIKG